MDHLGQYHGKTIQTTGYFSWGFETQQLLPPKAVFDSATRSFYFTIKTWPGLWVELNHDFASPDSIESFDYTKSKRLTMLQGIIDTTQRGHMGFSLGAIVNARFVVEK